MKSYEKVSNMDTQYSNILKAISPQNTVQNGSESIIPGQTTSDTSNVLTMSQKAQNYRLFDELMKNNVDLSEVLKNAKKSDDLQKQLDSAKKTEVDAELFAIMESAVKGEPSVKSARQRASDVKSKIITELCIKNPEYAEALHEYRRAVNEAYIKLKEGSPSDRSE